MKRHIETNQSLSIRQFDKEDWSIEMSVTTLEVPPLICELTLLLYDRSSQLSLSFSRTMKMTISMSRSESVANRSGDSTLSVSLNRNDMEFLLCFLLSWYRDGAAEARHIDIDIAANSPAGKNCTLVIKAEEFHPPLQGDVAKRMLGELR